MKYPLLMLEPIISSEWLNKNIDDPDLVILNASQKDNKARLATQYADTQIVGSKFFDLTSNFSDKANDIPNMLPSPEVFEKECRKLGINRNSRIVVYDNLGIYFSPRVWWMFKSMGHKEVAVLNGGLPDWVANGYAVEPFQANQPEQSGNFEASFDSTSAKSLEQIKTNIGSNNSLVIDARSEGRFNGTAPEPRKGLRCGHIPHSMNIPFKDVLSDGRFKSKANLTKVFESFRLDKQPLIFSCGSGLTACIVLLAAELVLDNHKSVFDGSWTEWALNENLPIETQNKDGIPK